MRTRYKRRGIPPIQPLPNGTVSQYGPRPGTIPRHAVPNAGRWPWWLVVIVSAGPFWLACYAAGLMAASR